MKKQLLLLFALFLCIYSSQAQCGPGQDITAPTISIGAYGTGTISDPFTSLLPQVVNSYPSGRYYFTFEGNTFQAELDNDTAGGGWLMVLNYVHQGGTNPALQVRSANVPLLNSSALGDDESGTENWGHFSNSLAAAIDFTHLRFYGETSGHNRIIHFETNSGLFTTLPRGIQYVKSGIGRLDPLTGSELYSDHSGNLPAITNQGNQNQGDYALTSSPFRFPAGFYQWNIGGSWDVDDRVGDVNNTIHRVWVKGDLSPVTKTPQSLVFELDPVTNTVSLTPTDLAITATDNCGVQNITLSQTDFDCTHVGDNSLTITATDANGNSRTANITITIKDPIPPVVQCVAPFTLLLDEFGKASITVDDISAGYSDNCNATASIDTTEFDCTHIGDNIVTLTVTDDSGNATTCSTTVTVDVSCPSDIIVDNDPNSCGAVVDYAGCGTLISGLASGSLFPIGTTNTILEITKADGTTSQCSFSVTVNDTHAPLFNTKDATLTLANFEDTVTVTPQDILGADPLARDYTVETTGTFDRVDISTTGTEVVLDDDDLTSALPIGFEFGFYGNRYTEFYISSNGFITFSDEGEDGCCGGQSLPDTSEPNNLIAYDWTDINPTRGGTIRYTTTGTAPNRIAIIDFDAVHYYDTTPDATTTQIKLFEGTNRIEIHGESTFDAGNNKTQGIENIDGTAAVVVPGRNASVWTTTNDYVAFVPTSGVFDNCGIDTMVVSPNTFNIRNTGDNIVTLTITDVNGNVSQQTATVSITGDCFIDDLDDNNFQIQLANETCSDKNNGILSINAIESLNYIATFNGEDYPFTSDLVIPDLVPGTYPLCIAIAGIADCQKCYEFVIEEAPVLEGKTTMDNINNKVFIDIQSGTAPYTVTINNKVVGEYNTNSFVVDPKNGGVVEVFSSKAACQGKLSTTIGNLGNISLYPNPTKANVTLNIPNADDDTVAIEIHNALGMTVSSGVYDITANKVELPMQALPAGIYFVTINQGTSKTLRIIKQ